MTDTNKEWLAYILIGGGSSWGRSPDREVAIDTAVKSLKDWQKFYVVEDTDVTVRVVEITGYDDVVWEYDVVDGKKPGSEDWETIPSKIERVTRHTPKWKRKLA